MSEMVENLELEKNRKSCSKTLRSIIDSFHSVKFNVGFLRPVFNLVWVQSVFWVLFGIFGNSVETVTKKNSKITLLKKQKYMAKKYFRNQKRLLFK